MQAFVVSTGIVALAEMGDKTQIATVKLAARYDAMVSVVAGTTLRMMLANVPVVFLGERVTRLMPLRMVHVVSALCLACWRSSYGRSKIYWPKRRFTSLRALKKYR